jgi:hypothetical protein
MSCISFFISRQKYKRRPDLRLEQVYCNTWINLKFYAPRSYIVFDKPIMKIESLSTLAFLTTLSWAQSPQLADYRSLCSAGQETGTKTFDNGITAEYTCRVKASSDVDPTEETATSSEECAAKCGSGCSSALWQYTKNRRLLYNSPISLSSRARGSVYLKPTSTAGDLPKDEELDCQHERKACEETARVDLT